MTIKHDAPPLGAPALLPPPSAARTRLYRLLGGGAIAVITAAAGALTVRYPHAASWIAMVAGPVCAYIGKLVGVPVEGIVQLALGEMKPEKAAAIAVQAMQSLPPDATRGAVMQLVQSMRPPPPSPVVLVDPSGHELEANDDEQPTMGRQS